LRRLHRTLDSSFRLISSTLLAAGACQRRAQRRPVRASLELYEASDLLVRAASRLHRVASDLAEVNACIAREPEKAADVPELLVTATARWMFMAGWLQESSDKVVALQHDILEGLQTGALVPERIGDSRPRIILAPRPVPHPRVPASAAAARGRSYRSPSSQAQADSPPGRPASSPAQHPGPRSSSFSLPALTISSTETRERSERSQEDFMTEETRETPLSHAEAAQQRVEELRRWREVIPHFVMPESADATQRLSPAASVPPEFIELTNVAAMNEPELVRNQAPTPAEVRDLVSYADAYDPLADELEASAQFLRHSVTAARNIAGSEVLTRYSLAQRLAKQRKTAHLAPYVADMRRALGRVRKLSPEAAAKRAAERAAKAAVKAAKTPPPIAPAPDPVQ
jgi:hypothetical protein